MGRIKEAAEDANRYKDAIAEHLKTVRGREIQIPKEPIVQVSEQEKSELNEREIVQAIQEEMEGR